MTKPLNPVKPAGMEIICFYPCPHCEREVPMMAPTQPAMVRCDSCGKDFPIVPVGSSPSTARPLWTPIFCS